MSRPIGSRILSLRFNLYHEKILITGCSKGFGYDSAKYLAEKGHHVYATMRNINGKNEKAASEFKGFAKSNNFRIDVLEIDVTSDESVN